MAREQIAKFYEVVTACALERAKRGTNFEKCDILREVNLEGVSIRTDIVLGSSDKPMVIFMITHSTKEVMWKEKFDRDSAEFLELFAAFPKTIRGSVLVVFNDRILPGLRKIAEFYLDAMIVVPELAGGKAFLEISRDPHVIETISSAATDDDKVAATNRIIRSNSRLLHGIEVFSAAIHSALLLVQKEKIEKATYAHAVQGMILTRGKRIDRSSFRHTRFNRGISKLALFTAAERQKIEAGERVTGELDWATEDIFWPISAQEKGQLLTREGREAFKCTDPEILGGPLGSRKSPVIVESPFASLTQDQICEIIDRGKQDMVDRYFARIRRKAVFDSSICFIRSNVNYLIKGNNLGKLLIDIAADPRGTFIEKCGKTLHWEDVNWNWLYTGLIAFYKATAKTKTNIGSKQGYGYSKIAEGMTTPKYRSAVEHSILQHLEYGLRSLDTELILEVGKAMAEWLKKIPSKLVIAPPQNPYRYLVLSEVEDKWMPHAIDVLPSMIEIAAQRHGISLAKTYMTSSLALASGAGGTAGRTNVYRSGDTIIWYKAAHLRQNVAHKRKELQSTVASWWQTWDPIKEVFVPTKAFKKTILVIDGDWEEEDLKLMHAFGWDEFLYPDELDRLPDLIV